MSDWLSPLNKIRIRRAVQNKATKFELDDGRKFHIVYNNTDQVYIKPFYNQTAPQGYFSVKKILDSEWLSDVRA